MAANVPVAVPLDTPDASGNGYPDLTTNHGFATIRNIIPFLTKSVDGSWIGEIPVPANYSSGGKLVLSLVANATANAVRTFVSTRQITSGGAADGAWTDETAVNTNLPGTANQDFEVAFTITPAITATGANVNILMVKVTRQGTNGGDTATVDVGVLACTFTYTTT